MARKRFTAARIIIKLREVEVAQGKITVVNHLANCCSPLELPSEGV